MKQDVTKDEKIEEVKVDTDKKEILKRSLDEDSDDESPGAALLAAKQAKLMASRQCPYLDTIDRGVLDFDFEKLCSVSLSRINCYACLVCGKYFQVGT